jgi:hypothetical protein
MSASCPHLSPVGGEGGGLPKNFNLLKIGNINNLLCKKSVQSRRNNNKKKETLFLINLFCCFDESGVR